MDSKGTFIKQLKMALLSFALSGVYAKIRVMEDLISMKLRGFSIFFINTELDMQIGQYITNQNLVLHLNLGKRI